MRMTLRTVQSAIENLPSDAGVEEAVKVVRRIYAETEGDETDAEVLGYGTIPVEGSKP